MISAIIILTLLSLLVATEPEPAGTSAPPTPAPPLQPKVHEPPDGAAKTDRWAA